MNLVYLILAKKEVLWERDKETQEKTWATEDSKKSIRYLYGLGDSVPSSPNSLIVDCADEYQKILEKTVLGVQQVLNQFSFDYLVRSNVSTYFDTDRLMAKIRKIPKQIPVACGFIEEHRTIFPFQLPYQLFISGSAIILNSSAAQILAKMDWSVYDSIPDDVAISHYLWTNNVTFYHLTRSNYHVTHLPLPMAIYRLKSSEFSELTSTRMKLLSQLRETDNRRLKSLLFFKLLKIELATSHRNHTVFRDFVSRLVMHGVYRIRCTIHINRLRIGRI